MNQFPIADRPSKGPMLGIVIIVILIILGGIYILASRDKGQLPDSGFGNGDTTAPTDSPAGRNGAGGAPLDAGQTSNLSDLETEAGALETDLQNLDQEAAQ